MCNVQRIIFGPNLVNHLRFFQFINSNYSSLREYRPMLRQFNECPPAALSLHAPHSAWPDKCHRSRSAREAFNLNICSSVKPQTTSSRWYLAPPSHNHPKSISRISSSLPSDIYYSTTVCRRAMRRKNRTIKHLAKLPVNAHTHIERCPPTQSVYINEKWRQKNATTRNGCGRVLCRRDGGGNVHILNEQAGRRQELEALHSCSPGLS